MIDAGCAVALASDLNPGMLFFGLDPDDDSLGLYLYEDEP